ncbi:hypothetical protein GWI33_021401, partial [Rhynchophorus ferrugineus]
VVMPPARIRPTPTPPPDAPAGPLRPETCGPDLPAAGDEKLNSGDRRGGLGFRNDICKNWKSPSYCFGGVLGDNGGGGQGFAVKYLNRNVGEGERGTNERKINIFWGRTNTVKLIKKKGREETENAILIYPGLGVWNPNGKTWWWCGGETVRPSSGYGRLRGLYDNPPLYNNNTAWIAFQISVLDVKLSKYNVVTLPRTKRSDLVYRVAANYGGMYEIRVSTSFPGSKAIGPLTYQVPEQLQPFKVRVTVNKDDDAFMIYWAEPYIPLSIGRYYYQVFVYPGRDLEAPYEKYYVTRPVMVYKGERGEYSFSVNFASSDRKYVSPVTAPIYANLNGEVYTLNATFAETPDR